MAKLSDELRQKNDELNDIEVEIIKVDLTIVKQYIENSIIVTNDIPKASQSLNDYLSSLPDNKGKLVIADLSEVTFSGDKNKRKELFNQTKDSLIDLRGVDFNGSIIKNTVFDEVDLTGAVFRDTNLAKVVFKDSKIANVDFRGADLSTTEFDKEYANIPADSKAAYMGEIKFSSTAYLMRDYAGITPDLTPNESYKYRTRNENIVDIGQNVAYIADKTLVKPVSFFSKAVTWVKGDYEDPGSNSENTKLKTPQLPTEKIVNASLKYIFGSNSSNFDPMYVRGSSDQERKRKKEFVALEDSEIREYLTIIKTEDKRNLSLNDFAKQVAIGRRNKQITNDIEIIADFSGKANNLNEWQTKNVLLSPETGKPKFDFRGANLSRANFAGANLEGYDFTGVNLDGASFESANLKGAIFNDTQANDVNFFNAEFSGIKINKSYFRRAFMSKSKGTNVQFKNSDLSYTDLRAGKWDNATLEEVEADYARLSQMSMSNATLVGVRLRRAAANGIIFDKKSKLERVNASESSMEGAIIKDSTITECNLNNVYAPGINIIGTEIDQLQAKNLDAEEGVLVNTKIKASDLEDANFKGAQLNNTSIKNTNMDGLNLENVDASNIILGKDNTGVVVVNDATIMSQEAQIASENESKLLFDNNGSIEKPTKHKEEQVQANIAENTKGFRSTVGGVLKNFGEDFQSNAATIEKPFNTYVGIGLGVAAGGIIAIAIAVAIIASAGSVLIPLAGIGVVAGVAGGCIVGGGVAGGVVGGVLAKRGGACGMAAAAAGTLMAGPIGGIVAVAAYFKLNKVVKRYTKYDIDTLISAPMHAAGMAAEGVGKVIDPSTPEGREVEERRSKQKQQYKKAQGASKKTDLDTGIIQEAKLKVLAEADKKAENLSVKPKIKQQGQQKDQKQERDTLDKIREQVKEFKNQSQNIVETSIEKFKRTTGFSKGK